MWEKDLNVRSIGAVLGLGLLSSSALGQGGLFVTGHDPDFHAHLGSNTTGARNLINKALDFVTDGIGNNGNAIGSVLLVTSRINGGGGHSDPTLGLDDSGVVYTLADDGTAGGGVLNLSTVNLSLYDAVVIASDFGGWLRQSELDILNSRSGDILNYINGGGGVVAFGESGNGNGLTSSGWFDWLPFLATSSPADQFEDGFTVTPFGAGLGLTDFDINGNASHNVFDTTGGMNVVNVDGTGRFMSLASYGRLGSGGVVPEPGTVAMLGAFGVAGLAGMLRFRKRSR